MSGNMIIEVIAQSFSKEIFIEIFWYAWMLTIFIAFFQKDDFTTKKLMLLATLFWWAHFFLQWQLSWLAACLIFIVRFFASIKLEKDIRVYIFLIWLTLFVWFWTYDGIYSILPILASINGTTAFFYLSKIKLRLSMILGSQIWLWYHIIHGSTSWVMNEIFAQSILIFTIYRMLHPTWGTQYYAQKIKDILWRRSRPDYDRFIFLHDKVYVFRQKIWTNFHKIIHYDLRNIFSKKKYAFVHKIKHN